jgi:hypothetical protein
MRSRAPSAALALFALVLAVAAPLAACAASEDEAADGDLENIYYWYAVTYFNGGMGSNGSHSTSYSHVRDYNKVWRPIGNKFGLGYLWVTSTSAAATWTYNSGSNPFVVSGTSKSAYADCHNVSGHYVSPVTCQTTHP